MPQPSGERHYAAKLTRAKVLDIRRRHGTPCECCGQRLTVRALARMYGVSKATAGHAITGRNWDIPGHPLATPTPGQPVDERRWIMGASTGSRASTEPASSLGPSGFDPGRERLLSFVEKVARFRFPSGDGRGDAQRFSQCLREIRRDARNLLETL